MTPETMSNICKNLHMRITTDSHEQAYCFFKNSDMSTLSKIRAQNEEALT